MKIKSINIRIFMLCIFLIFCRFSYLQAQTALEKAMSRINVDINMPSYFKFSQNEEVMSVIENSEKEVQPTIAQSYGVEPAYGNTFFMAMFGLVTSVIESEKDDLLLFVNVAPGRGGGSYESFSDKPEKSNVYENISLGGIKRHFQWGKPFSDASIAEANELYSLLTLYPKELAQSLFNAHTLVSYPINLRGNIYKNKYTRCKAVVVGKDRLEFVIIFMMTNENVSQFNNYLNNLKKVFWFNK